MTTKLYVPATDEEAACQTVAARGFFATIIPDDPKVLAPGQTWYVVELSAMPVDAATDAATVYLPAEVSDEALARKMAIGSVSSGRMTSPDPKAARAEDNSNLKGPTWNC
jgi:hypothetical protein